MTQWIISLNLVIPTRNGNKIVFVFCKIVFYNKRKELVYFTYITRMTEITFYI